MGDEVLDDNFDGVEDSSDMAMLFAGHQHEDIDARRRLEDKIEEIRLRREMQEFDFDA